MRSLMRILISLPVVCAPWLVGAGSVQTVYAAQPVGPTEALRLLAQGQAANTKCRHLTSAEHEELGDYVARAEVASVARDSVGAATSALKSGRAAGKSMLCGDSSKELVFGTLHAARRAISAANRGSGRAVTRRHSRGKARADINKRLKNWPRTGSLEHYQAQTAAYYIERRCQHLTYNQAVRFWKALVGRHQAMVRRHGPGAVKRAKQDALAKARTHGNCSAKTASWVRFAFSRI